MKRLAISASLVTFSILFMVSCGGGGAGGALSALPDEDYTSVSGSNSSALYKSGFYKKLAEEVDDIEDSMEDWVDRMDDKGLKDPYAAGLELRASSTESGMSVSYYAGPFKAEDLEGFYTDDDYGNWEWEEEDKDGRTYYKDDEGYQALFIHGGGYFLGSEDAIEEIIEIVASGGDKMVDTDEYREAAGLVDMNAAYWSLQFDEVDGDSYAEQIKAVEDDDEIVDPLEEIIAIGQSITVGNDVRIVTKIKFEDGEDLKPLVEFFEDEMEDIMEDTYVGRQLLPYGAILSNVPMESDDREDLVEDILETLKVSAGGNMLTLEVRITWEMLEDRIDD